MEHCRKSVYSQEIFLQQIPLSILGHPQKNTPAQAKASNTFLKTHVLNRERIRI